MTADVRLRDSAAVITWITEADLSDGLAELASAYGWMVERERQIGTWGRLDLVCHAYPGDHHLVIEVKQALTRSASIRKAFQQADGYSRYLASQGVRSRVILTAADIDVERTADPEVLYAETVQLMPVAVLIRALDRYRGQLAVRLERARQRQMSLTRSQRVGTRAINSMSALARKNGEAS